MLVSWKWSPRILCSGEEHVLLDDKHTWMIAYIRNFVYACIQNYERFLDIFQDIVGHSSLLYLFQVLDVAWNRKDVSNVLFFTKED